MSLWFQASPSNYDPTETRSIGFGQVKRGGSVFGDPQDNETSQMSAAAGGITQNFSSKVSISPTIDTSFNFDGPYFNNNSMTLTNAINNNILQNFQVNNLMQTIENIMQLFFGSSNADFEARITALETWRATGLDSDPIVMRDWSFDGTTIKNEYSQFAFVDGLITAVDETTLPDGDTTTTACP
jgi:hypothetical protein